MDTAAKTLTAETAATQPPVPAAPETAIPLNLQSVENLEAILANSRVVPITRSKKGLPCLWENGGGWSNTGEAQVITDGQGNPKHAIHVRTWGNLACREHALIPVQTDDHIVTVRRHWDRAAITVERIASIEAATATVVPETEPICFDAIEAAVAKSRDYHCREPYYIKELKELEL